MKAIDVHAHIFPHNIAKKASASIGDFYNMPVRYDGTVSTLFDICKDTQINTFTVHSVATIPGQVQPINNFIAETVKSNPGKLIGFATIHPHFANIEKEIDRIISMDLKGIKIHPDFQRFHIDSVKAFKIYEAIEGRLPILIHTGDYRYEYSKVRRMARVLDRFPRLDVLCAHLGGWSEWDEAGRILSGRRVKVDTSSSLYAMKKDEARKYIDMFGAENVLFGSDYPMWNPASELELIRNIGLSDNELEKILHLNAEEFLGLQKE